MGMRASSARLSNPSAFLISLIFPPPPPNLSHLLLLLTPPDSTRGEVEGGREGGRVESSAVALSYCGGCGPTLLQAAEEDRKKMAALLLVGFASGFCLPWKRGDALSRCLVYLLCFYSGLGGGLQVANRRHCLKKVGGGRKSNMVERFSSRSSFSCFCFLLLIGG